MTRKYTILHITTRPYPSTHLIMWGCIKHYRHLHGAIWTLSYHTSTTRSPIHLSSPTTTTTIIIIIIEIVEIVGIIGIIAMVMLIIVIVMVMVVVIIGIILLNYRV